MNWKFGSSVLTVLLLISAKPIWAGPPLQCGGVHENPFTTELVGLAKLENRLGHRVEVQVDFNEEGADIRITDPHGKVLGTLDVEYSEARLSLEVGTMKTPPEFQKLGVGESLLQAAIRAFPKAQQIETSYLLMTNEKEVTSALDAGMKLKDAIQKSPAYKIRARLGFTEVSNVDMLTYGFTVRRPSAP